MRRTNLRHPSSLLPVLALSLAFVAQDARSSTPVSVLVDQPVDAGIADGTRLKSYPKGASIELPSKQPFWISSRGFVPVLLVPVDTDPNQKIKVKLTPVEDWPSEKTDALLSNSLSQITESVFEVQKLLASKNTDRALGLLDQLHARFPGLNYLYFLRASALVMKGDRRGAISALKKALSSHPSHVEGQALLKILETGGKP